MARRWGAWRDVCQFWDEHIHFLELHYLYIAVLIFALSGLYYCQPGTQWAYIDALFMATTGATNTGLNTISMSAMSTWQLAVLFFGMMFGSTITVSFIVLMVRRHYFSKRFEDVLRYDQAQRMMEERRRRQRVQTIDIESSGQGAVATPVLRRKLSFLSTRSSPEGHEKDRFWARQRRRSLDLDTSREPTTQTDEHNSSHSDARALVTQFRALQMEQHKHEVGKSGEDDSEEAVSGPYDLCTTYPTSEEDQIDRDLRRVTDLTDLSGTTEYTNTVSAGQGVAFADSIDRQREVARKRLEKDRKLEELLEKIPDGPNSPSELGFDDPRHVDELMSHPVDKSQLTREQRFRIGGAEYRAINLLIYIVPCYFVGLVVLLAFGFRIYVACSTYAQNVLETSNSNGPVNTWFFCFFISMSAFTNLGLSHLDASMVPFQNSPAPLLMAGFLILAGNTAYPIFLRFVIWCMWKLTPKSRTLRCEALRYLLDHPRRCYTTLFPSTQTWWLFIVLIAITLIETVAFTALNYWLPVLDGISSGSRVLDGIFQGVATRNAGFSIISLGDLNPATQLVYIVAMYISVYPVAISMRNSNVYQERALGIFRGEDDEPVRFSEKELSGPAPFIRLRRNPTINSVMTTSKKVLRGPDFFVITQIQRQLTSDICWVIVGIFCICILESASTGFPNTSTSQSAQYRTLSKLVLIILMYRGRHRGLPSAIDRAVLLPSEQLEQKEVEDEMLRKRNLSIQQGSGILFYTRSKTL